MSRGWIGNGLHLIMQQSASINASKYLLGCAKFHQENNPWWHGNLESAAFVYEVYVSSNPSCCHDNDLPPIKVEISDAGAGVTVQCKTTDQDARNPSRWFVCDPPLKVSSIFISAEKYTQLVLCEVIANTVGKWQMSWLRVWRASCSDIPCLPQLHIESNITRAGWKSCLILDFPVKQADFIGTCPTAGKRSLTFLWLVWPLTELWVSSK